MNVPFFDLKRIYAEQKIEIDQAVINTLESGWYILGQACHDFESSLKRSLVGESKGEVIGCNSGTDALVLSLIAAGVGPGDEVITVAHTAIPTVSAIISLGATPVYVDIDSDTWLMDPALIPAKITPKTRAIIVVHLYGNMISVARVESILAQLDRTDIVVIEDTAQAHGSRFNGKQAGTQTSFGAFSFYPTKNLGALGDGGAVFCSTPADGYQVRMLRTYGEKSRYDVQIPRGINSRLDEIQAAILSVRLKQMAAWREIKAKQVNRYQNELKGLPLKFQKITDGCQPDWHLCVITLDSRGVRDQLKDQLARDSIQTLIHYPMPNHLQKPFADGTVLEHTEDVSSRILSLPMNPGVTSSEQGFVIERIRTFFNALQ